MKTKIKKFLIKHEMNLQEDIFFWLLGKVCKCKECYDGYLFPVIGFAPHDINFKFLTPKFWPDNFAESRTGSQHGVYYCPNKSCSYSLNYKKKIKKSKPVKRFLKRPLLGRQ